MISVNMAIDQITVRDSSAAEAQQARTVLISAASNLQGISLQTTRITWRKME